VRSPGLEKHSQSPVNFLAKNENQEILIPRVQVRIQSWEGKALLDTGSTHSLISSRIFKEMVNLPRGSVRQVNWRTKLLNGETCTSLYEANLHVIVAGRHIKHDFYIVEDMIPDCIIGTEIIMKMGIVPILDLKGFTFMDLLPEVNNIVPFTDDKLMGNPPEANPVTLTAVGAATELSEAQVKCFAQARELTHLSPPQQHQLEQTLFKYRDTITDQRIGFTDVYEHDIRTGNSRPIKCKPYRNSPVKRNIIKQKVQDLLDQNILVPSKSAWASPVCLPRQGPKISI
jgi:hypothetical protein